MIVIARPQFKRGLTPLKGVRPLFRRWLRPFLRKGRLKESLLVLTPVSLVASGLRRAFGPPRNERCFPVPFTVDVGCAVIRKEGKILITQRRKKDHLGGFWEFPGGKRIAAESLGACLEREVGEELGIRIKPTRFLRRIGYRYPEKRVSLYFYECRLIEGDPFPRACQAFRWVRPFELCRYPFPPADESILKTLSRY